MRIKGFFFLSLLPGSLCLLVDHIVASYIQIFRLRIDPFGIPLRMIRNTQFKNRFLAPGAGFILLIP